MKNFIITILTLIIVAWAQPVLAIGYDYNINESEPGLNEEKTSAVVDTDLHEIRLLKYSPSSVDFYREEGVFDYIGITPDGIKRFMFDGTQIQESTIIESAELSNPLSVCTSSPYNDVIVCQGSIGNMEATHYSFTGSEMVRNPSLTALGLTQVMSVESRNIDLSTLDDGEIIYKGFDGTSLQEIPALSINDGTNPIDMALFQDTYNMVYIDNDRIKYLKDGSVSDIVLGQKGAISISAGDSNFAFAIEDKVLRYDLAGTTASYNSALSVTSGLTKPTCVALKHDSKDMLIVDGNDVKYYMYDGSQMVYNSALSTTIMGLEDIGRYQLSAVAESIIYNEAEMIKNVKLIANQDIPEGTDIKYYLTANGTWVECQLDQWTEVEAGTQIQWKAELFSDDGMNTPKIMPIIHLEINTAPDPPIIDNPDPNLGDYYYTSSPPMRWEFIDLDDDEDYQTAYQVVVYADNTETTLVCDSGKVISGIEEYIIDYNATGMLWDTGTNEFWVKIKTWDSLDEESIFSPLSWFKVKAFDRPVITEIVSPATLDSFIEKRMVEEDLALVNAGSMVTMQVDSIGVSTAEAEFPYLGEVSNIAKVPTKVDGEGTVLNWKWEIKFYTDANTDICPAGTIVKGHLTGDGVNNLLVMDEDIYGTPLVAGTPNWWQWEGYRWWSEGVCKIDNSIFKKWTVVLDGRKG